MELWAQFTIAIVGISGLIALGWLLDSSVAEEKPVRIKSQSVKQKKKIDPEVLIQQLLDEVTYIAEEFEEYRNSDDATADSMKIREFEELLMQIQLKVDAIQ
jgi:hypothetical protein